MCLACILFSCDNHEKTIQQSGEKVTSSERIETLRNGIRAYPDSSLLIHSLIEAYRNDANYDSAMAITNREIQKDSMNAFMWNIKATLYFEQNDTLNAIRNLHQAIAVYPDPDYIISLGTIYAEIKNKNALRIADQLLQSDQDKLMKMAWFIKGLYYNFNNQPDTAIIFLDKSLQLDYGNMYAYREKAIALYNLKKYRNAIDVLKRAITLRNNYDEGYYWLGQCYEKLGQKQEAIQNYQNALLYDKDYVEARAALNRLTK